MRIRVYAPALADHSVLDEGGCIELPAGSRLRDLHRILKIPFLARPLILCAVNYRISGPGHPLADGDTVSYFSMAGGG